MISNITPTAVPDIVVGYGPRYDFHRVMDTGFRMLRALKKAVLEKNPAARLSSAVPREDMRWPFYDEDSELMMKAAMVDFKSEIDVAEHWCTMEAWPYQAGFHPFGNMALTKTHEGYRTTDGGFPNALDASPEVSFARSMLDAEGLPSYDMRALVESVTGRRQRPARDPSKPISFILGEEEHAFIRNAWTPFIEDGLEITYGKTVVRARFPHKIFGAGTGPLRIHVTE